jgi:hypothetical protein
VSLDELSGYPCRYEVFGQCEEVCAANDEPCNLLSIYRAHIALRRAVLGDMTAEEAARMYRDIAKREYRYEARDGYKYHEEQDRFNALAATVVEGMAP